MPVSPDAAREAEARRPAELDSPTDREGAVRPHHYWPSYQHMGDCAVCGHVAESPLHLPPERAPRRDLFDL